MQMTKCDEGHFFDRATNWKCPFCSVPTNPLKARKPVLTRPETSHKRLDALPVDTRIAEFRLIRAIGRGGFGIVYLAYDELLRRDVALKEYLPNEFAIRGSGLDVKAEPQFLEAYDAGLKAFLNEARTLAQFDHASIVKVHRCWHANGTAYIVMPIITGITLHEARRSLSQPPTEIWIRSVIDPILDALAVIHRIGMCHRDVAPDNILLPPDGPPVLLDFGASLGVSESSNRKDGVILKPGYAPIEQYANESDHRQGPWTDIYALGAVLYFLLFGERPAPATTRTGNELYYGEERNLKGISSQFLETIEWMLCVRPSERPSAIETVRAALNGDALVPKNSQSKTLGTVRRYTIVYEATGGYKSSAGSGSNREHPEPASEWTKAVAPEGNAHGRVGSVSATPNRARFGARVLAIPVVAAKAMVRALRTLGADEAFSPANATVQPGTASDSMMFAVCAPFECTVRNEFLLTFSAYVDAFRAVVLEQMRAMGNCSHRLISNITPDGTAIWKRGTPLTVRPAGYLLSFDPPVAAFEWDGHSHIAGFIVHSHHDEPGTTVLSIQVLIEDVTVAVIPLQISITLTNQHAKSSETNLRSITRAPSSIFASYSSKDIQLVSRSLSTLTRWSPTLDIFQDCLDLTPNSLFKPKLELEIIRRDVFMLFWSRNAANSPWVTWEYNTALGFKGSDAILPMPLEDPSIAPPPLEIADRHLRDRFMFAGYAMKQISDEAHSLEQHSSVDSA